jgi:hypothetical protein
MKAEEYFITIVVLSAIVGVCVGLGTYNPWLAAASAVAVFTTAPIK